MRHHLLSAVHVGLAADLVAGVQVVLVYEHGQREVQVTGASKQGLRLSKEKEALGIAMGAEGARDNVKRRRGGGARTVQDPALPPHHLH